MSISTKKAHTNRSTTLQKLFQKFLPQKAGVFGNNTEKEPQKPRPKLEKYEYYVFTENIYSACNPINVVVFCKNVLIL